MTAVHVPASLAPAVRRLSRRLTLGLFLDTWPFWAAGALLGAGCVAVVCRIFLPALAPSLPWLLAVPVLAAVPAIVSVLRRTYRPAEVLALADALSGGGGLVLAVAERPDHAWRGAPQMARAAQLALPRLRPWRRLAIVAPALAFLVIALLLPQRAPASVPAIADEIAADLSATLADLRARQEITPEEEEQLEEEIERVRRAAQERMDASAWEAADAVRDKLAAKSDARRDAAQWAQEALARYSAAAAGMDPSGTAAATAQSELSQALDALARTGALAGAPSNIQKMLAGGLPADAAALGELLGALAEYLEGLGEPGDLRAFGSGATQFDPAEFAVESSDAAEGDPGRGGVNRGRADAELTWGDETQPADRFKAEALPPGFVRSPDDWAPIVRLPGTPDAAPEEGVRSAARRYRDETGQAAWRRTLAPRHQSAVKKYFSREPVSTP